MTRFSASIATTGLALFLFAAASPAQTQPQTPTQPPLSKVRIVRISEVRGTVQLDRGVGDGFQSAIVNMPVVEQNVLKTDVGVAEVEFENSSTLRLGPNSEVDFILLGRTAQGAAVTTVQVVKGIAYISMVKNHGKASNVFDLSFGDRNIHLQPDTHVRLEVSGQQAELAVLKGKVQLPDPNQGIEILRKHTATFALANTAQPEVAKGVESMSMLDSWDKQLDQYHSRQASLSSFGGVPYSYGVSDMLYYGAFQNMGGCGMMWRPYFASAAWSPYSNGTWAYYAGAGYSWVSPYPWGWTPYHYGSWSFCPGAGWGWMPGGSWMGVNNIAMSSVGTGARINGFKSARQLPLAPHPPKVGQPSMVSVNKVAPVHSGLDRQGSFVFVKNSAGLGIPRNELGNLKGFSRHADQKGVASTPVYISRPSREPNGMRGARNTPGPVAIRRGEAQPNRGFPNARPSGNPGGFPSARSNSAPMRNGPAMGSPRPMAAPRAPAGRGPR